jgi:hypothetical protein
MSAVQSVTYVPGLDPSFPLTRFPKGVGRAAVAPGKFPLSGPHTAGKAGLAMPVLKNHGPPCYRASLRFADRSKTRV